LKIKIESMNSNNLIFAQTAIATSSCFFFLVALLL
jgi:hypothetical protein